MTHKHLTVLSLTAFDSNSGGSLQNGSSNTRETCERNKKGKSELAKTVARVLVIGCFVLFVVGVLYIVNHHQKHELTGSVIDDQEEDNVPGRLFVEILEPPRKR